MLALIAVSIRTVNEFLVYRYKDGDCLTAEDETAVVEKLLSYHPHSEDKIGCRLDYIMVNGTFVILVIC